MHKLAELCVKRPVFATVLILVLVVFGIFGYTSLGIDWFPKVDFPVVLVKTISIGTAPEEMETEITDKIEEAVNTISGIEELRSISSESVSMVVIVFTLEKDIDVAAQEVRDKINGIMPDLPEDIDQPTVSKIDPDASPVLTLALSGDVPMKELTEYADKVLRRRLESAAGVGQVSIIGGQARQLNVQLDPMKLRAYGLTIADVARALKTQNVQLPGGTVKNGATEFTLRTQGRVATVADLGRITVANVNGHLIAIDDLGVVEDGVEEAQSVARLDENPTLLLSIRKQSGTNTISVVKTIKERLEEILPSVPPAYRIEIVRDQSLFIQKAVDTVKEHLVLGSIFAAIVVMIFLANLRATVISALAIPTSIIATFAIIQYMGFTLNIITLLALTLSVGIVIDDAIVVLENIYRFIEEKKHTPREAAMYATKEIGLAVVAITLSLVAVFLPIAFMEGIMGRIMRSFGITMAAAIMISMIVSFSLTPMLASRWLRRTNKKNQKNNPDEGDNAEQLHADAASKQQGFYRFIEGGYLLLLRFSLRRRWIVIAVIIALLASIPFQMKIVRKNFLPDEDQSEFQIDVRAQEGTSLEATQVILGRLAREIRALEGVKYTVASVGESDQAAANVGSIYVRLDDVRKRAFDQQEIMNYIREKILPKHEDEKLRASVTPVAAISGTGSMAAIQYSINGPDMAKLEQYAGKVMERLRNFPGAVDIDSSLVVGKPQINVTVDRAKAADLGVSAADIASTLRLIVAGDKVSDYTEAGELYEIHVRADYAHRDDVQSLRMVTVPSMLRGTVPLGDVATFTEGTGPAVINRLNRAREVTVSANMAPNTSQQAVLDAIDETVASLNMGKEYKTTLLGQSKELGRAARAFVLVFLMAFVFIYLVIAAQFESWIHPVTILMTLPLTLPFALFSLIALNQSLNILSTLGVLVLFAVVKKNAILQIDHTIQLRAEGMPRFDAIIAANLDRLRPILMTTVAFVAGMLPLLVSSGEGSAGNRTISGVVVGGQTLSLLLTLVATPVIYSLFDDLANLRLFRWIFRRTQV